MAGDPVDPEEAEEWFGASFGYDESTDGDCLSMPDPKAAAWDKERGFDDLQLKTCLLVLEKICEKRGKDDELPLLRDQRHRRLREALRPIFEDFKSQYFAGLDPSEYKSDKIDKRAAQAKLLRLKAADKAHINTTKLRAERLLALQKLAEEGKNVPLVPDGVALPDAPLGPHPQGLLMGKEEESGADAPKVLYNLRSCYSCKVRYDKLHFFYDQLCPACADLNWTKRIQTADLRGRIAIVTGARVKIGFQAALKLLRCGATVVATTRFPHDAAVRYAAQNDFAVWQDNLHIYGLDLRDFRSIDSFVEHVRRQYGHVEMIVNNATQTVRRPTMYYRHLLKDECTPLERKPEAIRPLLQRNYEVFSHDQAVARMVLQSTGQASFNGLQMSDSNPVQEEGGEERTLVSGTSDDVHIPESGVRLERSVLLSQLPLITEDFTVSEELFPSGSLDINRQQVDLRSVNSWRLRLEEVEVPELVEVFAINALAPFMLNSKLIPLLDMSPFEDRYIVNVSAMEGKFYRHKTPYHPHTNMAKAAANMMTRTSSADLKERGIFMNSVDTGWINDENPRDIAERIAEINNFQTPLDEVDAAARILDPIMMGVRDGVREFGQFYKDYRVSEW